MKRVTVRIPFSAGHRLYQHEGNCRNLHGHNYVAYITAEDPQDRLDGIGRVIDFGVLKSRFKDWIDTWWDHGFLWYEKDSDAERALLAGREGGWKHYPCSFNPTAENMAEFLLTDVAPRLMGDTDVRVVEVKLFETENCYAVASLGGPTTVFEAPEHVELPV